MPPLGFAFGDLHGTASDEQIVESSVLQHKSALASAITLGDLGGRSAADLNAGVLADARVAPSNVTQHQGALTLTKSQISDFGGPYLPLSGGVLTGRVTGSAGLYVKNSVIAAGGQSAGDLTLLGNIYDRNCLAICDKRGGSITASFTGAGSGNSLSLLVNGNNDFGYILGTDNTTTQFQIVCDVGELQGNYGNAYWHPFVQYRLPPSNPATYYNSIVVEIAADSEGPWYKPPGGQWETSDYANNQSAEGLWIGGDAIPTGLPLYQWRYCRFTFSSRVEDSEYANKASVWIQQIGLRHKFEPFSRSLFRADGGTIYGDLSVDGTLRVQTSGTEGVEILRDAGNATLSSRLFLLNGTVGQGVSAYNNAGALKIATAATPGVTSGTVRMTVSNNGIVDIPGILTNGTRIQISAATPFIDLLETDETNKNWRIFANVGSLYIRCANDSLSEVTTPVQIVHGAPTGSFQITAAGLVVAPQVYAQTTDPLVAGAVWNDGGRLAFSSGS